MPGWLASLGHVNSRPGYTQTLNLIELLGGTFCCRVFFCLLAGADDFVRFELGVVVGAKTVVALVAIVRTCAFSAFNHAGS